MRLTNEQVEVFLARRSVQHLVSICITMSLLHLVVYILLYYRLIGSYMSPGGHHGRMVVGITTTCAIGAYRRR